jgi:hypothetical protein
MMVKLRPFPKNVAEIQMTLGLLGWYRDLIKDFAFYSQPLVDLTKKNVPWVVTDCHLALFVIWDLAGPINPTGECGHKYISQFYCCYSKAIEMRPLVDQKAPTLAKHLICVTLMHGVCKQLVTDKAQNLIGQVMSAVCEALKVDKVNTTAYHHQAAGGTERSIQTIKKILSILFRENPHKWPEMVEFVQFAYNTQPHASTGGIAPSKILHKREPVLPLGI